MRFMKRGILLLSLVATILGVMAILSLGKYIPRSTGDSRERAELEHGV